MKNRRENTIRGFFQLSRAPYGKVILENVDYIDKVTFGLYEPIYGGTSGEMSMQWVKLDGKIVPQLTIFSDAWSALATMHDLIDLLGQHDSEDPSPEEFCNLLRQGGFVDMTKTTRKEVEKMTNSEIVRALYQINENIIVVATDKITKRKGAAEPDDKGIKIYWNYPDGVDEDVFTSQEFDNEFEITGIYEE